jgi:hypothetical protein
MKALKFIGVAILLLVFCVIQPEFIPLVIAGVGAAAIAYISGTFK